MANKQKGSNAERELVKKFNENNWRAARVAGSGVMDKSDCDIIAGRSGRGKKYGIEVKTSKKPFKYVSKEQMENFLIFTEIFGLKPVIALRFNREGWLFIEPGRMKDSGNNFAITLEEARKKGKKFAQFFE